METTSRMTEYTEHPADMQVVLSLHDAFLHFKEEHDYPPDILIASGPVVAVVERNLSEFPDLADIRARVDIGCADNLVELSAPRLKADLLGTYMIPLSHVQAISV